ncbi:MAG TPA: flagellar biosynthetic protein FliO [Clostridia bacterium]|nr:flagellar biosynthetic protein FliO [Clostridia bacterium]
MDFFTALGSLIILLLVLYVAYVATRWLSQKQQRLAKGRYSEVIDSLPLGRDKWCVLVKSGQSVFVIGITQKEMHPLGEFPLSELGEETAQPQEKKFGILFQECIDRFSAFKTHHTKAGNTADE